MPGAEPPTNSSSTPSTEDQSARERFTLRQRIALWFISGAAFLLIRLLGPTLRFEISVEDNALVTFPDGVIFVFWHNAIIPACYQFRGRNIGVMTSSSFDGEYIARVIAKFGFRAVRGSSTRGGVRALFGMRDEIEKGNSVAFTIDGPRGPVYVAKPGPVLLARNTQATIIPFYIALERAWILNSWDRLRIPKPFSRAIVRVALPLAVPADADAEATRALHAEMQARLDRARIDAEAIFSQAPA
jgi:hypothetical protein